MGNWEFVVIFVLVLIGAGVTNLLHGVGTMIREAARVRSYWVHHVWLAVLLFTYLALWFSYFDEQDEVIGFLEFIGSVSAFSLMYLLTVLSFPDLGTPGQLDIRDHFLRTHRPYFITWGLVWLVPMLDTVLRSRDTLWEADSFAPLIYFSISVVGALSGSARVHAVLPVAILLAITLQVVL